MSWIFSQPPLDDVALQARAMQLLAGRPSTYLSGEELRAATTAHGVDLATAMAWQAFRAEPTNAAFLAALATLPAAAAPAVPAGQGILIVPTMYHRERPELGGDGAVIADIARQLGAEVETIAVASLGGIDGNAAIVASHLLASPQRRWVVSLSKGSADVKRALALQPDLAGRIAGWISIAGMPDGTPLADRGSGQPIPHTLLSAWLRLRGAQPRMLAEMGREHPFSRTRLELPPTLPVINVVPMPARAHLRKPVDRSAAWLGRVGPNDGYVLLEDALVLPGRVCPLWGADHYLRVPDLAPLLYRLLRQVLSHGE